MVTKSDYIEALPSWRCQAAQVGRCLFSPAQDSGTLPKPVKPAVKASAGSFRRLSQAMVALLATIACAAPPSVQAQWKWRDAQGIVHYSDQPPPAEIPERDTVRLGDNPAWPEFRSLPRGTPTNPSASQNRSASPGSSPASGAPSAGQQANKADPEKPVNPSDFRALADQIRKQDEKRNAQQKQKDEKTSQANELKQACATLRDELRTLESGIRIAAIDQAGQRQVMDDNQRAERTEQVRKNLQTHCKND